MLRKIWLNLEQLVIDESYQKIGDRVAYEGSLQFYKTDIHRIGFKMRSILRHNQIGIKHNWNFWIKTTNRLK